MFGLIGVIDNSAHEHEISAARGRDGNGKCQSNGERKGEEEDSEDKEEIFTHGSSCGSRVVQFGCVDIVWIRRRRRRERKRIEKEGLVKSFKDVLDPGASTWQLRKWRK